MIKTNEISVIIQGPYNSINTSKCIKSVRKSLPNCEIILSTWEGSKINTSDINYIIYNQDPGAEIISKTNKTVFNNINRQLVSTQAGIKKATKKYILKIRSDCILKNNSFLKYYESFFLKKTNTNFLRIK